MAAMPLSSSKTNISSDKTTTPEAGSKKTLTPQRKHRKLLKDGSGSEVWPESIEKIFVEGLPYTVFCLVFLSHRINRFAPILGITMGYIFSRSQPMAEPISSGVPAESGDCPLEKTSRQSYPSFAKYVERRAWFVLIDVESICLSLISVLKNSIWSLEERSFSLKQDC